MSRLELLINRWKAGSIKDPDLHFAIGLLHNYRIERLKNESKLQDTEGINNVPREDNKSEPKRFKAKGL